MEIIPCNLCGSTSNKILYKKPDTWTWVTDFEFPIVRCRKCGLVFVNPRPDIEEMKMYYPQDYHSGRDSEAHLKRYDIQAEFLPKLTNEKILDIGCAKGDFLKLIKTKFPNLETFGCDYFSNSVSSSDIVFKKSLLPAAGYSENQFDIITAWAVFEHLHNPASYFKEVSRILKTGGKFIFLVTNSESLYGKAANIEDIPRHLYHFSKKTLRKYAENNALKINKIIFDDRIFDGRGNGTFKYTFENLFKVTWRIRKEGKYSKIQRFASNIGSFLDRYIFKYHWESKLGISGIIIIEMEK